MNDHLRTAMARADVIELEVEAVRVGQAAIAAALTVPEDEDELHRREDEARQRQEAEAQRQRDLDAALADAIQTVSDHRARLGRKKCTAHDGATVRKIFELLRGLTPSAEE